MLGYRGVFRYTREPDLFKLELAAVKRVWDEFDNLQLMLPFVRTAWELEACLKVVDEAGLRVREGLWIMAEVPSVVHRLDDYAALGVTCVSIGSNDLTQRVTGGCSRRSSYQQSGAVSSMIYTPIAKRLLNYSSSV
jgi:pyruvate, water dikinase